MKKEEEIIIEPFIHPKTGENLYRAYFRDELEINKITKDNPFRRIQVGNSAIYYSPKVLKIMLKKGKIKLLEQNK